MLRWTFAGMLLVVGCTDKGDSPDPAPPPLGMTLAADGVTYAGVASIDLTPLLGETFTDVNGNAYFEGDLGDPMGEEPFDDVDGDGIFEPVWIGGFGPLRPMMGVHDPVFARAVVVSHDEEYVAFVALDLVGLGSPRIEEARRRIAADGFLPERMIAASSHNHEGPDTMGLWGDPLSGVTGKDEAFQQRVTDAIEQSIRDAASAMEPVELRVGRTHMRDRSPWFSGSIFGGKNPVDKMHGMIYDGRDPVVISDQLLVLQGTGESGTVFTLTNWSGHPEVRGDGNEISSDWVGVTREVLEAEYGGMALHLPECLGGMQSALSGDLPLVEPDGTHVFQTCTAAAVADAADTDCFGLSVGDPRIDADGDAVPEWAERDTWDFVTSHGWHIGEAAIAALETGEPLVPSPMRVEFRSVYVPIENVAYQFLAPSGLFDLALDDGIFDPVLCPEATDAGVDGCIESFTARAQLGRLTFVAVPGELLPELAWGFPDDARWADEAADPAARGAGAAFFPQHDPDCDAIDYADCRETAALGDCDCLKVHAWPYRLSDQGHPPILDAVDTEYKAVIGMANDYLSYIIPEPDFNKEVSLFSDADGDHYEDTVSPASNFATKLLDAQAEIASDW